MRPLRNPFGGFRNLNATRIVALSFGILILLGTLALMLPAATPTGEGAGLMTALFTATSASCVTGLSLVDTLTGWSFFGQAVILVMIQLGGLGFMTVLSLFTLALKRRFNLSQRLIIVSTLNLNDMEGVVRVLRNALRMTFGVEGVCALILACRFFPQYGFWGGLWRGLFTAVSAMCNAGFDLFGPEQGSLSGYQGDPLVLLVVMFLVVFGGLGFFVWTDLRRVKGWKGLQLYSKLVIGMSAALLVVGALFFFCAEFSNPETLGPMPVWKKLLNSLFQSVTLRTAGFYAFPQGGMKDSSAAVSCLLMLIGGSSGSTAGGIKTVTIAVLLLTLRAGLRGRSEVTVRGRAIPASRVINALTLVLVVLGIFFTGAITISLVDGVPFLSAAFESASAIGTVGLTTGITSDLSPFSHIVLIVMMYLGRVGILSFSIAFLTAGRYPAKIHYPTLDVMIG